MLLFGLLLVPAFNFQIVLSLNTSFGKYSHERKMLGSGVYSRKMTVEILPPKQEELLRNWLREKTREVCSRSPGLGFVAFIPQDWNDTKSSHLLNAFSCLSCRLQQFVVSIDRLHLLPVTPILSPLAMPARVAPVGCVWRCGFQSITRFL